MSEREIGAYKGKQRPIETTQAEDLARHVSSQFYSDAHKVEAKRRYDIYSEDFRSLIAEKIFETHEDQETKRAMTKFVDVTMNPALDMTRQLCMLWRDPVKRYVEGASEASNEALTDMYKESWIDAYALLWNQMAFIIGPVTVVPVLRGGRMQYETLLPFYYDVLVDPDNPYGSPLAVAWTVDEGSRGTFGYDAVVVDATTYRYYKVQAGRPQLVSQFEHSVGACPATTLRFSIAPNGDWYNSGYNQRLVDGTLVLGVVNAALNFTRKAQNKRLLVGIGDFGERPSKGQRLDPEIPLIIDTPSIGSVDLKTLDFDTRPHSFIEHALWIYQNLAEAYGASTVYMGTGASTQAESQRFDFTHERLTEVRNEQLPFARAFETELAWKTVALARSLDWDRAEALPQVQLVKEKFQVEFPKLSRTYANPMSEVEHMEALMRHGVISNVDFMRKYYPYLSDEEIKKKLMDNIAQMADTNDFLASRNMSLDADTQRAMSASQINGSMGGRRAYHGTESGESDEFREPDIRDRKVR